MAKLDPKEIKGRWHSGYALDVHTISSTPAGYNEAGHMMFDTTRSELGELIYRLKYKHDKAVVDEIVTTVVGFLKSNLKNIGVVVPVPPSATRALQPVLVVAEGIAKALNIPFANCVTATRSTSELKEVSDPEKRKALVDGLYSVDPAQTAGKSVLLVDDLFRSGTTLNAVTDVLLGAGKAATVKALTITFARSKV